MEDAIWVFVITVGAPAIALLADILNDLRKGVV
jgi:hypothetical protein